MSKFTPGPWRYNKNTNSIDSVVRWLVEPIEDDEGIPMQVISTFAAMGGENTSADIKLISKAPEMYTLIRNLRHVLATVYDSSSSFAKMVEDYNNEARNLLNEIDAE